MSTARVAVVLDSSVWISALLYPGNPSRLVALATAGAFDLYVCRSIRSEVLDVLSRPKFALSRAEITRLAEDLDNVALRVEPTEYVSGVSPDPQDDHVLACSHAAGAHYLVTSDKRHLLQLGEFRGARILSPRQFLEEWEREARSRAED